MSEKIGVLRGHLPDLLVENKKMYGVLSVGLHDLSEEECLKFYPLVLTGIEVILDEKISEKSRLDKAALFKKALAEAETGRT